MMAVRSTRVFASRAAEPVTLTRALRRRSSPPGFFRMAASWSSRPARSSSSMPFAVSMICARFVTSPSPEMTTPSSPRASIASSIGWSLPARSRICSLSLSSSSPTRRSTALTLDSRSAKVGDPSTPPSRACSASDRYRSPSGRSAFSRASSCASTCCATRSTTSSCFAKLCGGAAAGPPSPYSSRSSFAPTDVATSDSSRTAR